MNRRLIALAFPLMMSLLLGACVGRTRDCAALAGPGWTQLPAPPPDAPELLTRASLSNDSDLIWFGQGPEKVLICDHSTSLVNPGCGGSTAYPFERIKGKWTAQGVILDICKTPK